MRIHIKCFPGSLFSIRPSMDGLLNGSTTSPDQSLCLTWLNIRRVTRDAKILQWNIKKMQNNKDKKKKKKKRWGVKTRDVKQLQRHKIMTGRHKKPIKRQKRTTKKGHKTKKTRKSLNNNNTAGSCITKSRQKHYRSLMTAKDTKSTTEEKETDKRLLSKYDLK